MTLPVIRTPYEPIIGLNALGLTGHLYIGVENEVPEDNPKAAFWDAAGTLPAEQPIDVQGGYAMRDGTPAKLYTAGRYSIKAKTMGGQQVWYSQSEGPADEGGNDGAGFVPVAFRVTTSLDLVIPANNGWEENGGYFPILTKAGIDTHGAVSLNYDMGSLADAAEQTVFYGNCTAFIAPLDGVYTFHWHAFITGSFDQANVFQVEISHFSATGVRIFDDAQALSDFSFQTSMVNLQPDDGVFDNGLSVAMSCMIAMRAGEFVAPAFVRGVINHPMKISAYGTSFFGSRVAALPSDTPTPDEAGASLVWLNFVSRSYLANGNVYAESDVVTPADEPLIFDAHGMLGALNWDTGAANSEPDFVDTMMSIVGPHMADGCVFIARFRLEALATLRDDPYEYGVFTMQAALVDSGPQGLLELNVHRDGSDYDFKLYTEADTYSFAFDGADGDYQIAIWYDEGAGKCNFAISGGAIQAHVPTASDWGAFDGNGTAYSSNSELGGGHTQSYLTLVALMPIPVGLANADIVAASVVGYDPRDLT